MIMDLKTPKTEDDCLSPVLHSSLDDLVFEDTFQVVVSRCHVVENSYLIFENTYQVVVSGCQVVENSYLISKIGVYGKWNQI